jgi:hypothetical protein
MTNQDQAFIEGFVKRASEYGYSEFEAINLLKAADAVPIQDSPMNVAAKSTLMAPVNYLGDKLNQGVGAVKNYFNNFEATHPRVGGAGAENMFARSLAKKGNAPAPVAMPSRASLLGAKPQAPQVAPVVPQVNPAMMNEAIVQPNQRAYNQAPVIPATKPMRNEAIRQPNQRAYNQDPRTGRVLTPAQLDALND